MADRKLTVRIIGDSDSLRREFTRSSRAAKVFNRDIGQTTRGAVAGSGAFRSLGRSVAFASTAFLGGAGLAAAVSGAFSEMMASRKAAAQLGAVIKSTGGIAGVTVGHVDRLSQALLRQSGIDDELIKQSQAMLLTFTNVRNVVGKNNDIFDQAAQAVLDFSVALGVDGKEAAIAIGKALQDPVRGITALRRRGVAFTEAQQRLIGSLVESGNLMTAQKLILRELNLEYGGSAAALGKADGGLNVLKETIINLSGVLAEKFMPAIADATAESQKWLDDPANVQQIEKDVGAVAGAIGDAVDAYKTADRWVRRLQDGATEAGRAVNESTPVLRTMGNVFEIIGRNALTATKSIDSFSVALKESLALKNTPGHAPGAQVGGAAAPGIDTRPPRGGVTQTQRNRWFDAMIGRRQDLVQDAKTLQGQVGALGRIAALIRERLAITKDITRRLTLEAELRDIGRQQADLRDQIATNKIEARQLVLEQEQERLARERERIAKSLERIKSRQFRALGLAADGSAVVPGVENLRKQLGSLTNAVKGTFLDTDKTKSLMARIRKVLSGGFGDVSKDVRSTISGMLADIRQQLKDFEGRGPLTKTSGLNAEKLIAGLGLAPDQIRELRDRVSGVNSAGRQLVGAGALAGGGFVGARPIVVENHNTIQLDGYTVGQNVTRSQQKNQRRNPPQRRGPNRG